MFLVLQNKSFIEYEDEELRERLNKRRRNRRDPKLLMLLVIIALTALAIAVIKCS